MPSLSSFQMDATLVPFVSWYVSENHSCKSSLSLAHKERIGLLPDLVVFLIFHKKIRPPNTTSKFGLKCNIIELCFVNDLLKHLYVFSDTNYM